MSDSVEVMAHVSSDDICQSGWKNGGSEGGWETCTDAWLDFMTGEYRRILRDFMARGKMGRTQLFNSSRKYTGKRGSQVDRDFYGLEEELRRYRDLCPPLCMC